MGNDRKSKRSPLDRKPLRTPGESIQRQIWDLLLDGLLPWVTAAVMLSMTAAHELTRWYFKAPPSPVWTSALAILAWGFAGYRLVKIRRKIRNLRLGLDGEKTVGQFLEDLRGRGCRVFHDIEGEGFNLDHVVVAPQGIFVIETKTHSKPLRGQTVVEYDGEQVLINGHAPDRNPIVQVRALSRWLRNLLEESAGRRFPVRGVVVFPGWYVENRAREKGDVAVLNPKMLPALLDHEPLRLQPEDIALVASRITLHMQAKE
jgi:hypothetical protein